MGWQVNALGQGGCCTEHLRVFTNSLPMLQGHMGNVMCQRQAGRMHPPIHVVLQPAAGMLSSLICTAGGCLYVSTLLGDNKAANSPAIVLQALK